MPRMGGETAPGEDGILSREPAIQVPNDLDAYWMPFTANRRFKSAPRLLVKAKGMHYFMADGREILDGTAGLWCVNAGHCRDEITAAVAAQAAELDSATALQTRHPTASESAARPAARAPADPAHGSALVSAPAPVEHDPAMSPTGDHPTSDSFAVLRLEPWRLRVMPGSVLLAQTGNTLVWQERGN